MNGELQTESRVPSRESRQRGLPARLLKALHAEWRKMSPNLGIEPLEGETPKEAERRVRLAWTNRAFVGAHRRVRPGRTHGSAPTIGSWNELSQGEARFLLKKMKEDSGSNAAWRAMKLAQIAAELFGSDWDAILRERLIQRFRIGSPESLAPHEAHAEIEELLSRIARRDGVEIEAVRARFFGSAAARRRFPKREQAPALQENAPIETGA